MAQQTTPQRKRKKNPILRGIKKAGRLYLGNVRYGDTSFLFFVYVMILLGNWSCNDVICKLCMGIFADG